MRYKVGDKVKIREDLIIGTHKRYGAYYLTQIMKDYLGKVVTITKVLSKYYVIEEEHYGCVWTDEMIEHEIVCHEADETVSGIMEDIIKSLKDEESQRYKGKAG